MHRRALKNRAVSTGLQITGMTSFFTLPAHYTGRQMVHIKELLEKQWEIFER